jgi:hypothetical protein
MFRRDKRLPTGLVPTPARRGDGAPDIAQGFAVGFDRLRVVALLKPAARHRHDARLLVRQVDLIRRQRNFHWRLRHLAAGLLAGGAAFAARSASFA